MVRQAAKANAAEAASVVKQSTAALFPASHPLREPLLAALTPLAAGAAAVAARPSCSQSTRSIRIDTIQFYSIQS